MWTMNVAQTYELNIALGHFVRWYFFLSFVLYYVQRCQMDHFTRHIMCTSHSIVAIYSTANCHNKCFKKNIWIHGHIEKCILYLRTYATLQFIGIFKYSNKLNEFVHRSHKNKEIQLMKLENKIYKKNQLHFMFWHTQRYRNEFPKICHLVTSHSPYRVLYINNDEAELIRHSSSYIIISWERIWTWNGKDEN